MVYVSIPNSRLRDLSDEQIFDMMNAILDMYNKYYKTVMIEDFAMEIRICFYCRY